jgi:hypothetical protein
MGLVLKGSMLHSNHYRRLSQQTAAFAPRLTISKVTAIIGQDDAKSTPTFIPRLMTSDQSIDGDSNGAIREDTVASMHYLDS